MPTTLVPPALHVRPVPTSQQIALPTPPPPTPPTTPLSQENLTLAATLTEEVGSASLTLQAWQTQTRTRIQFLTTLLPSLNTQNQTRTQTQIDDLTSIDQQLSLLLTDTHTLLTDLGATPLPDGTFLPPTLDTPTFPEDTTLLLADLQTMDTLGQTLESLLNQDLLTESLTPTGTPTTDNQPSLSLPLTLLGGTATLTSSPTGRLTQATLTTPTPQTLLQLARLQAAPTLPQTPLQTSLQLTTPLTTPNLHGTLNTLGLTVTSFKRKLTSPQYGNQGEAQQPLTFTADGSLQGAQTQDGKLRVQLDTPAYLNSLTVTLQGTNHSATLLLWNQDGTSEKRALMQTGTIPVGSLITRLELETTQGTSASIQSLDLRPSAPTNTPITVPTDAQELRGTATIDLSQSTSKVTALMGQLTRLSPDEPFLVTAYRGETNLGTVSINTDGSFLYGDAQGITSLILSGGTGSYLLSNLKVEGFQGTSPTPADIATATTNPTLAKLQTPNLTQIDWRTNQGWKTQFQIQTISSGPLQGHTFSPQLGYLLEPNASQYSQIRLQGSNPQLQSLSYVDEEGRVQPYPTSLYTFQSPYLLLAPSTHPVDLWLQATNLSSYATALTGPTHASVLPPLQTTPTLNLITRTTYSQDNHGGWDETLTHLPSHEQTNSFTGHFTLENPTTTTMALARIEVHVGPTGTATDPTTATLNGPRSLPPGSHTTFAIPVSGDAPNQWSIILINPDNTQTLLQHGTFKLPELVGPLTSRDAIHIATQGLPSAIQRNLTNTVALYQQILAQAQTGTVSPALVAQLSGNPDTPNTFLLTQDIEKAKTTLRASLTARYQAEGDDLILATNRADYTLGFIAGNPELAAEEYGIFFDGSQAGIPALLSGIEGKVVGETSVVLAAPGRKSEFVVDVGWTAEVMDGMGGGNIFGTALTFLTERLGIETAHAESIIGIADAMTTPTAAMSFLQSKENISTATPAFDLRTDTVGSHIFLTLYRELLQYSSLLRDGQNMAQDTHFLEYIQTAKAAELLTGIAWWKILAAIDTRQSMPIPKDQAQWIGSNLQRLFTYGHYDHLFQKTPNTPVTVPTVINIQDATDYAQQPGYRRLRFDLQIPVNMSFDHLSVYELEKAVLNGQENWAQQNDSGSGQLTAPVITSNALKLYIDMPVENLRSVASSVAVSRSQVELGFKIVGWFAQINQSSPLQTGHGETRGVITVDLQSVIAGQLSTLPNTPENAIQRERENKVLTILSQSFPVEHPEQWHLTLASQAHHGVAFNAADLNWGSGAADENKDVVAIADGIVIMAGGDRWNTVIVEHTGTTNDGQVFYWYEKYLHMLKDLQLRHLDGSTTPLIKGLSVLAHERLGGVGDTGAKNQFHLHAEFLIKSNGSKLNIGAGEEWTTKAMDLRHVLVDIYHMSIKATAYQGDDPNGYQENVVWDPNIESWVTAGQGANNDGGDWLVYDRSEQLGSGGNSYWLAFQPDKKPNEMQRVVYKNIGTASSPVFKWVKLSDSRSVWDPFQRTFSQI